ncbi:MAG: Fic family protein [Betaproteobacteria bacterium]
MAIDRGEHPSQMEPLLFAEGSRHRPALSDLALELASRAAGFRSSLLPGLATALAHLVRGMNCYYSNLIEGHDTHPIDIERALNNDYSSDSAQRDLQLEAKAHITVQAWIDGGGLQGREATATAVYEIHRRFCAQLPEELLWVDNPDTGTRLRVVPGKVREADVKVGRHVPVSPGAVPRFMQRYEEVFSKLGRAESILASAAMHHRLVWIHPFLDGNGRVARLMSHAHWFAQLETGGVWSIARGLARKVDTYKQLLANCDLQRRNDLDGRGNLSEEALAEFTQFFLETGLDQVRFMEDLMRPEGLRTRILVWAEEEVRMEHLPQQAGRLLEAMLYRGELPRRDIGGLLGATSRTATRVTSQLLAQGIFQSDSPRAPLRLAFPAALASRWMPGLFPDKS